jgi:hypothetical protein
MNATARRLKSIEQKIAEMEPPESIKIVRTFVCPERGMVSAMFQGLVLERREAETEEAFKQRVQEFTAMEENL